MSTLDCDFSESPSLRKDAFLVVKTSLKISKMFSMEFKMMLFILHCAIFAALLFPDVKAQNLAEQCVQAIGNSTLQVCLKGNCTFECGKNSSKHDTCDQLCTNLPGANKPCPLLKCSNPRECSQRCMSGDCKTLDCTSDVSCVQSCSSNCSAIKCNSKSCNQHCEKGHCDTLSAMGVNADQTCSAHRCEDMHCMSTGSCNQECQGGGCKVRCTNVNTAECSQSCTKGGCSFECKAKDCESTCSHGNCPSMTCESGKNCTQICAKGCKNVGCSSEMCEQSCNGNNCNLECKQASKNCKQSCIGSCNATCTAMSCDRQSCIGKDCNLKCSNPKSVSCEQMCSKSEGKCNMDCKAKVCKSNCVDGNCPMMKCGPGTNCTQSCPGGSCAKMTCSAKSCDLKCDGGGCKEMTCESGVETCTMSCKDNCNMKCDATNCKLPYCPGCTQSGTGYKPTKKPPSLATKSFASGISLMTALVFALLA